MRTVGVALLLALVMSAVGAATASASSIVFIKEGNVWLANPDGSGQYQVTTDGGYRSPSQADDGTIFAVRGTGTRATFHKMKQNGELLAPPFEGSAPGTGPLEASISPDGSKAAYSFLTTLDYSCYPYRCGNIDGRVLYTHSDRFTPSDEIYGPQTYGDDPSWVANDRILFMNNSSTSWTDVVGPAVATQWFNDYDTPGAYGTEGQSYRDGEASSTLAALIRVYNCCDAGADGATTIQLFNRNGGPADFSTDPTPTCAIHEPGKQLEDPTLSPDSTFVAWQEPGGISSVSTNCADTAPSRLIIPGGSEPDWGPADVNPGPRPQPPGPGPGPGIDTQPPAFALTTRPPRLAKALKSGIPFTFSCSEACTVNARLLLGKKAVASGRKTLSAGGSGKVVVKFSKAGKKALRKKKKVTLTLRTTATDAAGNSAQKTGKVKLRR